VLKKMGPKFETEFVIMGEEKGRERVNILMYGRSKE
jgi:hypothetical protein